MLGIPRLLRLPSKLRRRARRRRMATLLGLLSLFVLLLAPFYAIYRPPIFLIRYFAHRWPDVLWEVQLPQSSTTAERLVALTIDDAPSSNTREILRVLAENGARATFFVIGGQVSGREEVLQEMVRSGHELGNHAMHDEPARALAQEQLEEEILAVQAMIDGAYAAAAEAVETADDAQPATAAKKLAFPRGGRYFRPGSGLFSDAMRALVQRMGYKLVLGGIYPHDAQIGSWRLNAQHILSMVRPGGIIICHDRRDWTVPMLQKVLPELKTRGYRAVTVTELLKAAERS